MKTLAIFMAVFSSTLFANEKYNVTCNVMGNSYALFEEIDFSFEKDGDTVSNIKFNHNNTTLDSGIENANFIPNGNDFYDLKLEWDNEYASITYKIYQDDDGIKLLGEMVSDGPVEVSLYQCIDKISPAKELAKILNSNSVITEENLRANSRVGGEILVKAKVVKNKIKNFPYATRAEINNAINKNLKYLYDQGIYQGDSGDMGSITALINNPNYDVVYKTGKFSDGPTYNSDGIMKDFMSLISDQYKKTIQKALKKSTYGYIRAWSTASEYDGIDNFYFQINQNEMVIIEINNCGGC